MRAPAALAMMMFAGCVAPIPRPTDVDVLRAVLVRPQTTLADLERGRTLYVSRCGGCHRAYPPRRLAPTAWPAQVDEMAQRAKLGTSDRELVLVFLVTLSSRIDDHATASATLERGGALD